MLRRIGRKIYNIYALDVESHNDIESVRERKTSIWLGCLINETSKVTDEDNYFYTIEELLGKLQVLSHPRRTHRGNKACKNVCIYIYNLSFEWSFILPVLLRTGYKFSHKIDKESDHCYNSVSTRSCSSVWEAHIKIDKDGGDICLRDLAKMYSGGLGKVAKSFGLPTQKGEIDYTLDRRNNWRVTDEEKLYNFKDTKIVMDILEIMAQRDDKDFFATCSMAAYTMRKMIKDAYPHSLKPYHNFRKQYPELGSAETAMLRRSVHGGLCYPTPNWQFKDIRRPMQSIDATQMHPTQMVTRKFPFGRGEYFVGQPPKGKISCCHIIASWAGVKLHSCVELVGEEIGTGVDLVKWNFEIPTMRKVYEHLEIEYIDGYAYNSCMLPFRHYIKSNLLNRVQAIAEDNTFEVLYYKLLNNSAYGKFLEKPHNDIIENTIDPSGVITSIRYPVPDDDVKDNAKYTYIPVGSCVAAYSRCTLIETAIKFDWHKVVYFDTDSIWYLRDPETIATCATLCHRKWFGGWEIEHEYIPRFQSACSKRYKFETPDGKIHVKCAGINNINDEVPFEEINIISSEWQVKRAYRCEGGTVIDMQHKSISVQPKYEEIFRENMQEPVVS